MNATIVMEDSFMKVFCWFEIKVSKVSSIFKGLGRMFYVASPADTTFPDLESIPFSYISKAPPYFFGMIALEWAVKYLQGDTPKINNGLLCIIHGLFMILMQ